MDKHPQDNIWPQVKLCFDSESESLIQDILGDCSRYGIVNNYESNGRDYDYGVLYFPNGKQGWGHILLTFCSEEDIPNILTEIKEKGFFSFEYVRELMRKMGVSTPEVQEPKREPSHRGRGRTQCSE